ncbi:hypothetical protein AEAC466_04370 [Asticcacaulis sp. AC466]|uniref:hypothetical protein n=1 Tax=Asticcacaulis sp. AC466 TaxID=1282362 RepID=UPI0003C3C6E6|nr:hypothetical protein [Asticcacaulis sp. AC466]ESQ85406.1 hypothetical protein AEAC466_04370 [Asticcacaulis sp. AC466]
MTAVEHIPATAVDYFAPARAERKAKIVSLRTAAAAWWRMHLRRADNMTVGEWTKSAAEFFRHVHVYD